MSGVIGLALGDLCLFHCMAIIGPRLGTVLMALAPAMTAVLAVWWIGELLGVSPDTAASRFRYARGKLKEWLGEDR